MFLKKLGYGNKMRYLTKEWYRDYLLLLKCKHIETNKFIKMFRAGGMYKLFYPNKFKSFLYHQQNLPGFNVQTAKRIFDGRIENDIELFKSLPERILREISDLKLLALGYATKKVKRLLRRYCGKLKWAKRCAKKVFRQNGKRIFDGHSTLIYEYLIGIEEYGGDVYLEFDWGEKLQIKNGIITEGKGRKVYKNTRLNYGGEKSHKLHEEFYSENGGVELHLLMENTDSDFKSELWYLTVSGSSIKRIEGNRDKFFEYHGIEN